MAPADESRFIQDAVRDGVARALAVMGLAGFALIHLLDLPDTMSATPYLGWMYVGWSSQRSDLPAPLYARATRASGWQPPDS